MSSSRSLVFSAVIAAVIAIALVSGVVAIGVLNTTQTTLRHTGVTSSVESNSSVQVGPASQLSATVTTNSQSTSSIVAGQGGSLAVLMTDPPTVPDGVTSVFINYSNLAIHISSAGNATGWHSLGVAGQIDLMSVINSTQTVAEANITSGNFNALAFNITSAVVTFQGVNYSADLVYQDHELFVPIVGGIDITDGQTSAAVIDLTPTVLLLGNVSDPVFAFIPSARAYTIPAQSVSTLHLQVGDRDKIQNASWWVKILHGSKFGITGITLTSSSLSFTISNSGNSALVFRIADLSSTMSPAGGNIPISNLASTLSISEVFVIEHNSTLVPITVVGNGVADKLIDSSGYLLPIGNLTSFSYSGSITLGAAQVQTTTFRHMPVQEIVPGQKYVLTLIGNGLVAQAIVTAS